MGLRNTSDSWGLLARLFHWTNALVILGLLAFGFFLSNAYNPGDFAKFELVQLHKSFGFVAFSLAVLRVAWRAFNPPPDLPDKVSGLQKAVVRATHVSLYVLILLMPLSGWLMSSASPLNDADSYPFQVKNMVFGLFEMPDPIQPGDRALSDLFAEVHFYAGAALAGIVGLHILGALYHALVEKDGVMSRMLKGKA